MKWIFRIATVLTIATLLSSCLAIRATTGNIAPADGEVYAVKIGTTLWGMKQAVMEKSGTLIMMKDNLITFVWTVKDGWCFAVIDAQSETAVQDFAAIAKGGNMVSPKTMSGLVDWMKANGWSIVGAKDIPQVIVTAITASAGWLVSVASNMTTFVVVPAGFTVPPGGVPVWR